MLWLLPLQQRGAGKHPKRPGGWLPGAHCGTLSPPRKGNRGGARVNEIRGSGRWSRNSGAARAAHTQTGRNLFCPGRARSRRSRQRRAPRLPKPSGRRVGPVVAPREGKRPAGRTGRAGAPALRHPGTLALPLGLQQSAGVCWDPALRAAPGRRDGDPCQGPRRHWRGRPAGDGGAVTSRDPQARAAGGRARARRGPGPRGPARARQAGPLFGGAPRSQHMVGGGAPPRPAETGCSRYRIRDRQPRRGAGARAAARKAGAQASGVGGGGRGEGVARVVEAWEWVGARVSPAGPNLL